MDSDKKDILLALLQIESQHRQRIDSVWTQFKDAMLAIHGLAFAVLASLITVPGLSANERISLVAFTVLLDMLFLFGSRRDIEKSAAGIQSDYAADYHALMGVAPPRLLYSRALKMRKKHSQNGSGISLLLITEDEPSNTRMNMVAMRTAMV